MADATSQAWPLEAEAGSSQALPLEAEAGSSSGLGSEPGPGGYVAAWFPR